MAGTSSKRTTSIVDISEIEDDDDQQQQQQHHDHQEQEMQSTNPRQLGVGGPGQRPNSSHSTTTAAAAATNAAHLYLYHEDLQPQQRISSVLSNMINLKAPAPAGTSRSADTSPGHTLTRGAAPQAAGSLAAIDYHVPGGGGGGGGFDATATGGRSSPASKSANGGGNGGPATPLPGDASPKQQHQQQPSANLGTLTGVYFPCVQNIFGVILFIRMVWIVGTAGVPAAFAIVFICCCVTLTTSISLSAIATNGIVPAGGSYFMISRSLGPECGGAVGTMFFLGTTVAGAMYITGAVEIILNYLAPSWGLFGDFQRDVSIMYNNIRVYGTLLLIIVGGLVMIGVRFVSKLAPIALFCVLFSIFSIYAGILGKPDGRHDLVICVVGDRLVTLKNMPFEDNNNNNNNLSFARQTGPQFMGTLNSGMGANNGNKLQEDPTQFELRRTRALCTYDKLKYVFCPSSQQPQRDSDMSNTPTTTPTTTLDEPDPNQQSQAHQQPMGQAPVVVVADERQQMLELFKRQPNMSNCDAYFRQNRDRIHLERAVPGIASGILFKNLKPRFREKGTIVGYDEGVNTNNQQRQFNWVFVDISTSFTALIAIYFPSCTGILAGSNRSGDLADAQKSIPLGTISAQLTTSFVYLSCIVLFGSTFNNLFIRDKFGESMGGQLAVTQIAWPLPYLILVGGLLSTLGASLQSLVGAPRILQGIAKDDVIPCFRHFAKLSARGEPETAIFFTLAIAEMAVLIGNLDFIAPILTLSLVMCYFFINLACTLHSLLGSPNWRPRFRHYHWSISTLGCLLCLFVMIVSSWIYFALAIVIASCIYKYIEFHGAEKEWGDGKQGLALSAATYNLLRLKTTEPHTKNYRPQLLLFCKLKPSSELEPPFVKAKAGRLQQQQQQQQQQQFALMPHVGARPALNTAGCLIGTGELEQHEPLALAHPRLLMFASQLKAGKGVTLVSSVLQGDYKQLAGVGQRAQAVLQESIQREKVRGFATCVVANSILDGLCHQMQTAGLGGLKHNTVILGWPTNWRKPNLAPKPAATSAAAAAATSRLPIIAAKRGSLKGPSGAIQQDKQDSHQQQQQQQQQHHHPTTQSSATQTATQTRAHLFIQLMRNVQVSQNALLVVKGVDSWPDSCDKLGGFIDIWWIVNDGGLLMLLPHLLRQHRTWKGCQLRIFTVAQSSDNSQQMRQDLEKFLYHLRIAAQVEIVEMKETEISDYAYERTLMMEQRSELMKRLNIVATGSAGGSSSSSGGGGVGGGRRQSLLLEQEVDGRLIKFRIRKPSTCDFEETIPFVSSPISGAPISAAEQLAAGLADSPPPPPPLPPPCASAGQAAPPMGPASQGGGPGDQQQSDPATSAASSTNQPSLLLNNLRPDEANVRRMHTALSLNEAILRRSKSSKLVIINLPGAPKESTPEAENNYMEFVEIITDKLERVLLIQNGGREIFSKEHSARWSSLFQWASHHNLTRTEPPPVACLRRKRQRDSRAGRQHKSCKYHNYSPTVE